jgi:RNA polymerase sigma-70 factor, ECF subfamily
MRNNYTQTQWSDMNSSSEDSLSQLAEDVDMYYEKLVAMYWYQLKIFVLRRVGNAQDAEDLVQDTFIRAYVALERYSVPQRQTLKARSWLYKIAWNICCNFTNRSPHMMLSPLDMSDEYLLQKREEDKIAQPEEFIELIERRQELETLVATLPQQYGVIVSLYYFEDLNLQEIADVLNRPLSTVKVYIRRGIQALRKMLIQQAHEVG